MKPKPKGKLIQQVGKSLKKSSPTILTVFGAVGVVVTAVLVAKETPMAIKHVDIAAKKKQEDTDEPLTKFEAIKAGTPSYIPAIIAGSATIMCIFSANILNRRQQASLMSAYAFLDRSFREYKKSVTNVFGEEGQKKVMEDFMAECPKAPTISGTSCFTEGQFDFGETDEERHMFYDVFSKRYFEATYSQVLLAELHVNRNFAIGGGEVSLHYFYDFLGLDTPDELKDLAWYVCDYFYFVDFTHEKMMIDDGPDHEPVECWAIDMPFPPTLEPIED